MRKIKKPVFVQVIDDERDDENGKFSETVKRKNNDYNGDDENKKRLF